MLRLSSRSLWLVLLMALALSACQQEQETTAVANEAAEAVADVADADEAAAGPAPLLDREIFFRKSGDRFCPPCPPPANTSLLHASWMASSTYGLRVWTSPSRRPGPSPTTVSVP